MKNIEMGKKYRCIGNALHQDTAAIEQRVAEACAKRFDQMADEAEVDLAFSVLVEYFRENASTFRSGKWREFL